MKMYRNKIKSGIWMGLIVLLSLCFIACSDTTSPIAPVTDTDAISQLSGFNQDDLNFISLPNSSPGLKKVALVSERITADQGGVLNLTIGSDFELIRLIEKAPYQITTWALAQELLSASPLSPTVLMAMCKNPGLKNDYWTNTVLQMNQPLRACVLSEFLDNNVITNSWDLMNILSASSPLPQNLIGYIDHSGMTEYDVSVVRSRQIGDRMDESQYNESNATLEVSLRILPGAIEQDTEISISSDDELLVGSVDLLFSPHGTTFNPAAILNLEACGLDFRDIDVSKINIFYDNQESGTWQAMDRSEIIIRAEEGYIRVIDAKLPHFSRYAVAYSN